MNIIELHCEPNHKNVTVCLSYENIRDIANGLYEASKVNPKYEPIHRQMLDVFGLVKEGTIKSWWKDDTDGVVLPKEHGRLIAEPTEEDIEKTIGGQNDFAECIREAVKTVFANAPTIIEASKDGGGKCR